ncbi:MAG: hypothetical protein Q8L98_00960 [Chlamydiales bacterium]|nr:hypothetical protein [Chlamydiales bacterium]
MFSSITTTYNFVSNNMPSLQLASPGQMARNIALVALPTIALVASSQMSFAEAGPIACAACLGMCAAGTYGGIPLCMILCAAPCAAPTP